PRWHQAAQRFLVAGFRHIFERTDLLLFVLCLVMPFRRLRPLVVIVAAFTVAHSLALLAAAVGFAPDALWFPPLTETLIALTIISVLVAHTAWHWMLERGEQLLKFPFPKMDAPLLASAMRGLMAMLILGGLVALANNMLKPWIRPGITPARDPAE